MKGIIFILSVLVLVGCASSTVINSLPDGARVEKGAALLGITPYDYWDREVSDTSATFTLKKDGYKDKEITIKKDVLFVHRIFFPPLLALPWLNGYQPQYIYKLESDGLPITNSSNSETQSKSSYSSEYSQKLRDLKKLKDEGLLTEPEYEQKRKAIVDSM